MAAPQPPPPPRPDAARPHTPHALVPRPVPGAFGRLLKQRMGPGGGPLPPQTPAPAKSKARPRDDAEPHDASPTPSLPVEARDGERRDRDDEGRPAPEPLETLLDPTSRHLATLAPPPNLGPAPAAPADAPATHARLSLEELMPLLVKRIAWSGDKHQGSVRLEIGAGAYAGATVIVHADGGRVRVEVGGHGDLDGLRTRLDRRLRRHGLDVESVT